MNPSILKKTEEIKLNFKQMGSGRPLIVLHGLFGSLDNWMTLGRKWSEDFSVYLLDLRNHGRSPHTSEHTLEGMARDVIEFMDQQNIQSAAILGHSMGGKVVMELALKHPDRIRSAIIADMGPQQYERGHDQIFEAFHSVDFSVVKQRRDITHQLEKIVPNPGIVAFLAKNAVRTDQGFRWRMNLDALESGYENILQPIVSDHPYENKVLVLKGEKSPYVTQEAELMLLDLFPRAEIQTIPEAGHWLHAEQPELFYKSVREFLLSDEA